MQSQTFKAKYLLRLIRRQYNPFTPDTLVIDDKLIQHRRRNWYLISCDTQTYHFQNIIGVDVDKALFGANIIIQTNGAGKIILYGFSKRKANQIAQLCSTYIGKNTQRSSTEDLAGAVTLAIGKATSGGISVADELGKLKSLADSGVITQQEFEEQKRRVLSA